MQTSPPENRYIVPGLVRGMRLLEQFTHNQQEWGLSELFAEWAVIGGLDGFTRRQKTDK